VLDVDAQDVFEVAAADDQEPVETSRSDRADEPLGVGVCLRRSHRRVDHPDPFAVEHLVERRGDLLSRSWIRKRIRSNRPVKLRLRACCTTQAPVGFAVQPAKWTRRLSGSMKKEQVEAAQGDRLDGEEVAGQGAGSLAAKERPPAHRPAPRHRREPSQGKHTLDRAR
jgi:hypothetical protein